MGAAGHGFRPLAQAESGDDQEFSGSHIFRLMTAISPDLIYLYDRLEERYPFVSSRSRDVLGYAPHEMRQLRASDVERLIHPQDRERVRMHYARQADLGDDEVSETIYRMAAATGEYRMLRCRQKVFSRNDGNQVRLVLGHATDLTRDARRTTEIDALRTRLLLIRDEERQRIGQAMGSALDHLSEVGRLLRGDQHAAAPSPLMGRAQALLAMAVDGIAVAVDSAAPDKVPAQRSSRGEAD